MSQITEPNPADVVKTVRDLLAGRHVCPFCGGQRANKDIPCPRCTMEDTPATRQATVARVGPWYVLQSRNPSAPGMRWATLIALVRKGQIGPRTVIRGPVTNQLWAFAARVRGLSRELGVCYDCGQSVGRTAANCGSCGKSQEPPMNPDSLLEDAIDDGIPSRPLVMREITSDPETALQLAPPSAVPPVRRDPRPRHATIEPAGDDAILSARELAAAFQLDGFAPPRKGRKRRILALLLLLALVGVGTWLTIDAERREQAISWTQAQWARLTAPAPAEPKSDPLRDDPEPTLAATNPNPAPQQPANPDDRAQANNPTPPSDAPPPVAVDPTPPGPVIANAGGAGIEPDLAGLPPKDQARELHRRALDAIGRGDNRTALRYLEQMESLPANAHTGDLQSLLHLVRQRIARAN